MADNNRKKAPLNPNFRYFMLALLAVAIIYEVFENKGKDSLPLTLVHKDDTPKADIQITKPSESAQSPPLNDASETVSDTKASEILPKQNGIPEQSLKNSVASEKKIITNLEFYQQQKSERVVPGADSFRQFDGITTDLEKLFYQAFQGRLVAKNRVIRLNLAFNKTFDRISRDTCFGVKVISSNQITTMAAQSEIQILRNDRPGYLLIIINKNIFLEVFLLSENRPVEIQAYISSSVDAVKTPFVLLEKPTKYDGTKLDCEDFW